MGLFSMFKRKKVPQKTQQPVPSKSGVLGSIFSEMAEQPPSRHFVAGSVFDYVRQNYDLFATAVSSGDMLTLQRFFITGYQTFLRDPAALGSIPAMVDSSRNDTDPFRWNMNVMPLRNGDKVFLCFMPVQSSTHQARIFAIVLGSRGDGYYYCMLNKDQNQPSTIIRNKAIQGIEPVGTVKGIGFQLMDSVIDCIRKNYYA